MFRLSGFIILLCLADVLGLTIFQSERVRKVTSFKSSTSSELNIQSASGIYVHIPYCRRRCSYCDFAIVPVGDVTKNDLVNEGFRSMDEAYRKAVLEEIEVLKICHDKNHLQKHQINSIYFGGGTPSLAPIETIEAILSRLIDIYDIPKEHVEITMEMDPGTFNLDQLQFLKNLGINRISLGVQSFNDTILEGIGRVHRERDIMDALSMIRAVYGEEANMSIDLISGLPGLTTEIWKDTLERVLDLNPIPKHLSVYDLQIEEGTVFGRWYTDEEDNNGVRVNRITSSTEMKVHPCNKLTLPSSEECATMYRYASAILRKNGFEHYEISSYARLSSPTSEYGTRSKHNQLYWNIGSDWYAVGLSATSSFSGNRFARPRRMSDYMSWVGDIQQSLRRDDALPPWLRNGQTEDDKDDLLQDIILTRLRTKEGLDLHLLQRMYDLPKYEKLIGSILKGSEDGINFGLAVHVNTNGENILRLVDPEGFLFSNTIISTIFSELP